MSEQVFQVGIKGIITNSHNEILLLHMSKWGRYEEHWDLPGGRIDSDEDFVDTLKRELQEELGVDIKPGPKQLLATKSTIKITVGDEQIPLILIAYHVNLADGAVIKLSDEIHEDKIGWFSKEEAAKLLVYKYGKDFAENIKTMDLS